MGMIINILLFFGRMPWVAAKFVVKTTGKLLTYMPASPRGKFLYGSATASSVYFFNDDQYEALEHVFIHSGSTHDFNRVIKEFLTTDISFAKSASNYLTNDYGKTMMVHVGLTAVTVVPLGILAVSGVKNAKAVTSSVELLSKWGTKLKNFKFLEYFGLFSKSSSTAHKLNSLSGRVPVSKRQKFLDDFTSYFKKVTMKGKPAKANSSDSVHARMTNIPTDVTKVSQIKNVMLRKDVIAIESIMTMFLAYWLAQNTETSANAHHETLEGDMKKIDLFINDSYNFYFANTILGGDIHKIKTAMRVDFATAKHIFISYMRTGVKIINTWLNLNEMDRIRYHRLVHTHLKGVHAILNGRIASTNVNISIVNTIIEAIASNDQSKLISTLALQRTIDKVSKKAVYSGLDDSVTFRYLFHFIADNDQIKELYADGAAIQTMIVQKKSGSENVKTQNNKSSTTDAKVNKAGATKDPISSNIKNNNMPPTNGAFNEVPSDVYDQKITDDMLSSINAMVSSSSDA